MTKAVLDNNVIISAILSKGAPSKCFFKLLEGDFLNYTSPPIIDELRDKLLTKFNFPAAQVQTTLELLVANSEVVYSKEPLLLVEEDPSDNKIIECAVQAEVDFIVSGDKHLLNLKKVHQIKIINPSDFLYFLNK
ncbi:MAG: putative toxin-antitoxin system toxin component, PIN family [bacterium]|nr:putative toxin-antitoxin system toxin component, PIN family [bacterium]